MLAEIVNATNALEGFATFINEYWTDQPYNTAIGGWNMLPLSRGDMALRARRLAERLKTLSDDSVDSQFKVQLNNLPNQLAWFQANTIPQMQSANATQVITNFDLIISNIEQGIPAPTLNWESIEQSTLLPRNLARRIRNLESSLDNLTPRAGDLSEKIEKINEAHTAASDLPTDLQMLKEARDEVAKYSKASGESALAAKAAEEASKISLAGINSEEETARKLISNIDAAYSAATTSGLAASFTERAQQLSRSTWIWVGLLLSSLVVGGLVGSARLNDFQKIISDHSVSSQWVWLDASMSILAIAGPVWFAWVATRQIGQRFRLAEDYGFKASVARAYEGYRKEAARLNPELEARLFTSALDRLDEAPLRFLSMEEHSSPYESLLASAGFQKALEKIPDLRATLLGLVAKSSQTSLAGGPPTPSKITVQEDIARVASELKET